MATTLGSVRRSARRLVISTIPKQTLTRLQSAYRPAVAAALRGDAVECPVCDSTFRHFLDRRSPSGEVRPGAQCPRCGSLERHRVQWLYLRDETDLLTEPKRLLHIAPEPGFERRFRAAPKLEYLTGDLESPPAMARVDVTAMPFEDGRFDVVICNHVLEHVPDDGGALTEILRVLRPDGWAMVDVPLDARRTETFEDPAITDPGERERMYGQCDHVRIYGRDYENRVRAAGFDLVSTRYQATLSAGSVERYGLTADDELFVARPARA